MVVDGLSHVANGEDGMAAVTASSSVEPPSDAIVLHLSHVNPSLQTYHTFILYIHSFKDTFLILQIIYEYKVIIIIMANI